MVQKFKFIAVKILITPLTGVRSQQVLGENTIYEDLKGLFYAEKRSAGWLTPCINEVRAPLKNTLNGSRHVKSNGICKWIPFFTF